MRRPFLFFLFFRCCWFSSYSTFPAVFSRLCLLFSFPARPLGHSLLGFLLFCFFLSVLWDVYSVAVLRLPPLGLFQSFSGSTPLLRHPLHFPICLCFSPVPVISPPPPFTSDILGFGSVLEVATSAVPAVAPPSFILLYPFWVFHMLQFWLLLAVFCMLWLQLPFPVFLSVSACCSSGCSFRSSFPFSTCCVSGYSFRFGAAPAVFLAEGCGSSGLGCFFSLCLYSFPIDRLSLNAFVSHRFVSYGCILSLGVSSSSCLFEMFFDPASVPPQPVCLAMFVWQYSFSGASDSFGSPVPFMTWSPFGTSQGCCSLCSLGFWGDFIWWYLFCVGLSSFSLPRFI